MLFIFYKYTIKKLKNNYLLEKIFIMAKTTSTNTSVKSDKSKKKRPGVHAKSKSSKLKQSKNYLKKNTGQGK
jgi:hypothetical protein